MRRRRRRGRGRRWDQAWGSPRVGEVAPTTVRHRTRASRPGGAPPRHVTGCSVPLNRHATTTCKRYRAGRKAASGSGQAPGPPAPTRLPIANARADRRISMCKSNVLIMHDRASAATPSRDARAARFLSSRYGRPAERTGHLPRGVPGGRGPSGPLTTQPPPGSARIGRHSGRRVSASTWRLVNGDGGVAFPRFQPKHD
jgi:hypothetical protein